MKHFRTLLTLVAIVTASLYAYCEPLVLEPPFKEGQTLKYLITTDVILSSEEAGSKEASISTELQIDVVKTNDNGTVMNTRFNKSKVESDEATDLQKLAGTLNDMDMTVTVHVNPIGRPDSILNINEIRELCRGAIMKHLNPEMFSDTTFNYEALIELSLQKICSPKRLLSETFESSNLLTFYGYDLNSGIFPSSEIVGYKLAALDPELKTLLMATKQNNDIVEVTLSGNGDKGIKVKGSWTFANNLLQHGSKKITWDMDGTSMVIDITAKLCK